MATPILNIPELAQSQANKEAAINAATRALENATQRRLEVAISGDQALDADDYVRNFFFDLTGTPGVPFSLTVPDTERAFYVMNNTDGEATVIGTGVSVAIPVGEGRLLYNNATDILQIGGGAGGGGGGANETVVACFFAGAGVDENAELTYVFTKEMDLLTDFGTSQAYAEVADATGITIDVEINGTPTGTINFGAAANVATFTATEFLNFASPGDRLKLIMPASLGTLAGISITLIFPVTTP